MTAGERRADLDRNHYAMLKQMGVGEIKAVLALTGSPEGRDCAAARMTSGTAFEPAMLGL